MKALQCEFCGGKLMAKAEGIFECTSCGMLYDRSRIQEMVQEITGTVQVEGVANADSLLRRGYILLEDGEWTEADGYFEKVLSIEPENARAYLGKLLADRQISRMEELPQSNPFVNDKNWKNAKKFSDSAFAAELESIEMDYNHRQEEIVKKAAEKRRIVEERLLKIRELLKDHNCPVAIVAGGNHTIGLKADGTAVACGNNYAGQSEVSDWKDIVNIAAGKGHTVGLKLDGTVVACGDEFRLRCNVSGWRNIVAITASDERTIGLKADGTVVACGRHDLGQSNLSNWQDIVAIAAHDWHTVGLKTDGTVVACGDNYSGQCEVSDWADIVAIAAGKGHTLGLKSDGTVKYAYKKYDNHDTYGYQYEISNWRNIVAIVASNEHMVGLKADGTVVACGNNDYGQCDLSNWRDIVAIAAGDRHTVGLKSNGSVIATRYHRPYKISYAISNDYDGQCEVSGWQLFKDEADLKEAIAKTKERRIAAEKTRQDKIAALNDEKSNILTEMGNMLFGSKRKKVLEARLAEIDEELKKLSF